MGSRPSGRVRGGASLRAAVWGPEPDATEAPDATEVPAAIQDVPEAQAAIQDEPEAWAVLPASDAPEV